MLNGECWIVRTNGASRATTPGRFLWSAGLYCLSRSSSQAHEIDQIDRKDQTNQSPATHREM